MEKELNYKLTGENTELVKGESSQKAIENQEPKGSITNTVTVNEVKELDKKNDNRQDADIERLEQELPEKIEQGIESSLVNGSLKTVLQNKSLSVSEFPLTSDIDTQHLVVNAGLLPNGDMEDLSESDISKLTLTLNRIINKGWLKVSSTTAIRLTDVFYTNDGIFVVASTITFGSNNTLAAGSSYKIFLDPANALYEYEKCTYSSNS